jgi:hypothetical protein
MLYKNIVKIYKNRKCVTYTLPDGRKWYNILYLNDELTGAGFLGSDLDKLMTENEIPLEEKSRLFVGVKASVVEQVVS